MISDVPDLKVSASNFDDMFKSLGLDGESVSQLRQRRNQGVGDFCHGGDMHGGGEAVDDI